MLRNHHVPKAAEHGDLMLTPVSFQRISIHPCTRKHTSGRQIGISRADPRQLRSALFETLQLIPVAIALGRA